jgi:hypothetical protein
LTHLGNNFVHPPSSVPFDRIHRMLSLVGQVSSGFIPQFPSASSSTAAAFLLEMVLISDLLFIVVRFVNRPSPIKDLGANLLQRATQELSRQLFCQARTHAVGCLDSEYPSRVCF